MSGHSEQKEDEQGNSGSTGVSGAETDRYGFLLGNGDTHTQSSDDPCPQLVRHREMKWLSLMNHWDEVLEKKNNKIKGQCQKGIPASVRAKCWPLLCGATHKKEKNEKLYQTLDSAPGQQSWIDVIKRDTDRQFPFHEMFLNKDSHGQQGLLQVLKAYTQFRPEEGYCQAQGPVAAVLLMNMPIEEAFWCLVQISELYLPGYYSPLLEGVLFDAAILSGVLKRTCPAAHKHLQRQGVEPLMFATDWLMCLYSRHLPFNTLLRVWDLFFCYGVRVLFQVAVVLVRRCLGEARQRKECEGQMETLEQLRAVRGRVQHEPSDTFIQEVCSVPLSLGELQRQTEKELQKWRKERPGSTFDPRDRCHGFHMVWEKGREREKDNEKKMKQSGNLTVQLMRSHSSLSPALLRKKWRKRGSKADTDDWEGGGRRFSQGVKEENSDGEQRRRSVCGTAGEFRPITDSMTCKIGMKFQKDHSMLTDTDITQHGHPDTQSSSELSDHSEPVFEEDENDTDTTADPTQNEDEANPSSTLKVDLPTGMGPEEMPTQTAISQSQHCMQTNQDKEKEEIHTDRCEQNKEMPLNQEENEGKREEMEEPQTQTSLQEKETHATGHKNKEETQENSSKQAEMELTFSKQEEESLPNSSQQVAETEETSHIQDEEIQPDSCKQEEELQQESFKQEEEIQIQSKKQEEKIQMDSCKHEEEIQLDSVKQKEEAQLYSGKQVEITHLYSGKQEEEAQLESGKQEEETQLDSGKQEEETQLDSGKQEEETQLDSGKQEKETQLNSGKQEEETQLDSGKQEKETQLDSGKQEEETQLDSGKQEEETQLDSGKQEKETQLDSGKQEEQAQLDSGKQEEQAQLHSGKQEKETQLDSGAQDEETQLDSGAQDEETQLDSGAQDKETQPDSCKQEQEIQLEEGMEADNSKEEVELQISNKQDKDYQTISNAEQDIPDEKQQKQEVTDKNKWQQTSEEQNDLHLQCQEAENIQIEKIPLNMELIKGENVCESKKEAEGIQQELVVERELEEETEKEAHTTDKPEESEGAREVAIIIQERTEIEHLITLKCSQVVECSPQTEKIPNLEYVNTADGDRSHADATSSSHNQQQTELGPSETQSLPEVESSPKIENLSNLEDSTAPDIQLGNPNHAEFGITGGPDQAEPEQPNETVVAGVMSVHNDTIPTHPQSATPANPPKPAPPCSSSNPHTHLRLRKSSSSYSSYPSILSGDTFKDPNQSDKQEHTVNPAHTQATKTDMTQTAPILVQQTQTSEPHKAKDAHTDKPKRRGLFHRFKSETSPKTTVPKILIQDFSEGEEKLSAKERRRRRREQERKEKEEEKERKKREKELEKQKEKERKKPQTRGKSFQEVSQKCSDNDRSPGISGSQTLGPKRNSAPHSENYF